MTWHGKQSETKQSKNKTLDVPVNIGVTLCQRRLNRLLQSAEKIWTYWHENLGALRQSRGWIVTMCFPCAPETLCMWRCVPPLNRECVETLSLHLRLVLAWGLKSRAGQVDASLSSEGCFKLHCTHSLDPGSLVHWYWMSTPHPQAWNAHRYVS